MFVAFANNVEGGDQHQVVAEQGGQRLLPDPPAAGAIPERMKPSGLPFLASLSYEPGHVLVELAWSSMKRRLMGVRILLSACCGVPTWPHC
jgi:hypothetical protein